MESEVASLLAELDPCVFVIDCLPNMNESSVRERTVPLVKKLRESHNKTPILLVEDRSFTNTPFFPSLKVAPPQFRRALAFSELVYSGLIHIYYLDGALPTDHIQVILGMIRYADAYEPVLRDPKAVLNHLVNI